MKMELIPLGKVESWILITASNALAETYKLETEVRDQVEIPETAYNGMRKQYDASKLLKYIKSQKTETYALGILDKDIYSNRLNFVFGQAEFGCCAVLSVHRLKSKQESRYKERVEKEVNHEVGHCLGLGHCSNRDCVMAFSNSIIEVDLKGKDLCANCNSLLNL